MGVQVPMNPTADESKKPCGVCTDFRTAAFGKSSQQSSQAGSIAAAALALNASSKESKTNDQESKESLRCPPDSVELGRASWTLLHTMAAYYPEHPSDADKAAMTGFIQGLVRFYPCQYCATHLQKDVPHHPPNLNSNVELSQWFCQLHNRVNQRLGKPQFDCSRVLERWKDGSDDCIEPPIDFW
jgi:FAD-linked sulfhydryl oxidase